jgi:predicted aldo/keto reductase-like oxidoreductase
MSIASGAFASVLCQYNLLDRGNAEMMAYAKARYRQIGVWPKGRRADGCTHCGVCEAKCPQRIAICAQLDEVQRMLGDT